MNNSGWLAMNTFHEVGVKALCVLLSAVQFFSATVLNLKKIPIHGSVNAMYKTPVATSSSYLYINLTHFEFVKLTKNYQLFK